MKLGWNKITGIVVIISAFALTSVLSSFYRKNTLKGNWIFKGGIYNGKPDTPSKEYDLQRRYTDSTFDAYMLEPGEQPLKYQSGKYTLKVDTCLETETYSLNPSKLTNITIRYHYAFRHDTLVFSGKLPTGMVVEEYWKRQK